MKGVQTSVCAEVTVSPLSLECLICCMIDGIIGVCVCGRACVRACVCMCVCVCNPTVCSRALVANTCAM